MRPVKVEKWSDAVLDHQIMLAERKAVCWARVFKTPVTDFYPKKYCAMILEKEFRHV